MRRDALEHATRLLDVRLGYNPVAALYTIPVAGLERVHEDEKEEVKQRNQPPAPVVDDIRPGLRTFADKSKGVVNGNRTGHQSDQAEDKVEHVQVVEPHPLGALW